MLVIARYVVFTTTLTVQFLKRTLREILPELCDLLLVKYHPSQNPIMRNTQSSQPIL